uniref:Uncharacterized protein n=1 Tax=Romanomermis culicivorax TaxID=13658 RepID=A0A915LAQ7_ROMCU
MAKATLIDVGDMNVLQGAPSSHIRHQHFQLEAMLQPLLAIERAHTPDDLLVQIMAPMRPIFEMCRNQLTRQSPQLEWCPKGRRFDWIQTKAFYFLVDDPVEYFQSKIGGLFDEFFFLDGFHGQQFIDGRE